MTTDRPVHSAVVFADITDSTRLYAEVGDERAREMVVATLDEWARLASGNRGEVVQRMGDGMLCRFPTVDAALTATMAMRDLMYEKPLSMHAGIDAGPVTRHEDQLYGDAVNTAARMSDIAKAFEIVITQAAQLELSDSGAWNLRLIRKVPVKGKTEPMNIYLIADRKRQVTDYRPPPKTKSGAGRLVLRHGTSEFVIDSASPQCVIGRDDDCGIKVYHQLVSRRHASIECLSSNFFLQDHSTNGTYVDDGDSGGPVLIQREMYQLKGKGVISLGVEPKENPDNLIAFVTEA